MSTVGTGTTRKLRRYGTVPTWPQPRPQLAAPGKTLRKLLNHHAQDGTSLTAPTGPSLMASVSSPHPGAPPVLAPLRRFVFLVGRFVQLHQPLQRLGQTVVGYLGDFVLALFHAGIPILEQRLGGGVLLLAEQGCAEHRFGVERGPVVRLFLFADGQALAQRLRRQRACSEAAGSGRGVAIRPTGARSSLPNQLALVATRRGTAAGFGVQLRQIVGMGHRGRNPNRVGGFRLGSLRKAVIASSRQRMPSSTRPASR